MANVPVENYAMGHHQEGEDLTLAHYLSAVSEADVSTWSQHESAPWQQHKIGYTEEPAAWQKHGPSNTDESATWSPYKEINTTDSALWQQHELTLVPAAWPPSLAHIGDIYRNMTCQLEQLCTPSTCGVFSPENISCSCHEMCLTLGECCINYESACLSGYNDMSNTGYPIDKRLTEINGEQLTADALKGKLLFHMPETYDFFFPRSQQIVGSCMQLPYTKDAIRVVAKCPLVLPLGIEANEVAHLCENVNQELASLDQLVPVKVNKHLYRNIHCAYCNLGKNITAENGYMVEVINPSFLCSDETSVMAFQVLSENGTDDLQHFLMQNCELYFAGSREMVTEFGRYCTNEVIRSCDHYSSNSLTNFKLINEACLSYSAHIQIQRENEYFIYKNLHCAICNDLFLDKLETASCFEEPPPIEPIHGVYLIPSFTMLMSFTKPSQVDIGFSGICNQNIEILEIESNKCIEMPCPKGQMPFNNSFCIHASENLFVPFAQSYDVSVTVTIVAHAYKSPIPKSQFVFLFNLILENHMGYDLQRELSFMSQDICPDISGHAFSIPTRCIGLQVYPNVTHSILSFFKSSASENFFEDLNFAFPFKNLKIESKQDSSLQCHNNSIMAIEQNFTFTTDVFLPIYRLKDKYSVKSIQEKNMDIYMYSYGIAIDIDFVNIEIMAETNLAKVEKILYKVKFCMPNLTICNENQYPREWNGPIASHAHKLRDTPNCFLLGEPIKGLKIKHNESDFIESIISFIGISLSMTGLFITVLVYSLVPSLLNTPGKALMNLSISLFVAQGCFLCSPLFIRMDTLCGIIAALQHYFWLVSFTWMNVLSFDMWRTFTSDINERPPNHFKWYALFGWGFPGVIVVTCLVMEYISIVQYMDIWSCWLSSGLVIGLAFGLPVASMLMANVFFYSKTLKNMNQAMGNSATINVVYNKRQKLFISIKLCSIMGFTWIFGFLSNIGILSFIRYAFIISCSMNGLFICLAFTFTRTVRKFVYRKYQAGRNRDCT